jgi:2-dehydropantoate 2-reductase
MAPFIISTTYGHQMKPDPIWYIAGIGALGSVMAASFNHHCPVKLLLKDEARLTEYQQTQLTLITGDEHYSCQPQGVDIAQVHEPIQYLICCVKAYDVKKVLLQLKHQLNANSIIILIHNGLGVFEEIAQLLPELRIISGICTIGAYLEKPFTVRAFLEGTFHLGAMSGEFTKEEIKTICTTFQNARLPCQWEKNIQPLMWQKFALNCCINALTALFACKNSELLKHLDLLKRMTSETAAVLNAYGIDLSEEMLLKKVTQLLEKVGDNYSSMYKDVQQNRPTEIGYLNGYLVYLAKQKNINVICNEEILTFFIKRRSC